MRFLMVACAVLLAGLASAEPAVAWDPCHERPHEPCVCVPAPGGWWLCLFQHYGGADAQGLSLRPSSA